MNGQNEMTVLRDCMVGYLPMVHRIPLAKVIKQAGFSLTVDDELSKSRADLIKAKELLAKSVNDINEWLSVYPDLDCGSSDIRTEIETFLENQ